MLRREVVKMAGSLFGLGAGTPSRFPYRDRPQPAPAVGPSTASTVRARTVIVFGPSGTVTGVFVYRPGTVPALGNPPVEWMTSSTVDPFGNPIPANTIGSLNIASNNVLALDGGLLRFRPAGAFAEGSAGIVSTGGIDIQSPLATNTDTRALIEILSAQAASGGVQALELLAGTRLVVDSGGMNVTGESTLTPQVMSGHPVIEQTDQSVNTVTAIVNTAITTAWPIGANDAQAGTVYRLRAGGYGAQGSTQETLRIQLTFMGVNIGSDTLPAATIPASAQFQWTFDGSVSVVSTGAAGKARAQGTFTVWQLGGTATAAAVIGQHAAVPPAADTTVNTTAAQTVHFDVSWGAATGAPTITSGWSTLARSGA